MRWDDLFAELDLRFEELAEAAEDAEYADRVRGEFGRVTVGERLRGALGGRMRLRLTGDQLISGVLTRVGIDWLLVQENPTTEVLIPLSAVSAVEGIVARTGVPLGTVDSRFDLRKALRSVARDRAHVAVRTLHGGELSGTVDRIGLDFVELAAHPAGEVRRSATVRTVLLIPLAAIVLVRSVSLG